MSPILFYDNFFGSLRFPLGLNRNNKRVFSTFGDF